MIDATGDLDVAASAGAPHIGGAYMLTTVFRLGNVDTDAAERFEREQPEAFAALDKEIKRLIGGSWAHWWLKTPLPGVVWCNCPHMTGLDGLEGRGPDAGRGARARAHPPGASTTRAQHLPGFERCVVIDVAPQTGVRQTRLLEGEYVITKEDLAAAHALRRRGGARPRLHHALSRDAAASGIDNLLVAGRHYSATSTAQKMSREIPPCMAMGEAAGVAAAMALDAGVTRARRRRQGACRPGCARRAPTPATRPGPTPTCRPSRRRASQREGEAA